VLFQGPDVLFRTSSSGRAGTRTDLDKKYVNSYTLLMNIWQVRANQTNLFSFSFAVFAGAFALFVPFVTEGKVNASGRLIVKAAKEVFNT
jgi:hypothetical protein